MIGGGVSLFKRKNGELKQISSSSDSSGKDSMIRVKWPKEGEVSELEYLVIAATAEILVGSYNTVRIKYSISGKSFIFTLLKGESGMDIDFCKGLEIPKIIHNVYSGSTSDPQMFDTIELISFMITNNLGMSISKEEVRTVYDKYSMSYDEFYGDIELSTAI